MAVVMDIMAILMATTMVTGIVIIVVQGVALAIGDEIKEQGETIWIEGSLLKLKFSSYTKRNVHH
jgi:hypothetical protein